MRKSLNKVVFIAFIVAIFAIVGGAFLPQKAEATTLKSWYNLPNNLSGLFTDYTMTELSEDYNTAEALDELKKTYNNYGDAYDFFIERAYKVLKGEIRYNGLRDFSTNREGAQPLEQFGDMAAYSKNPLGWRFYAFDGQVTGIYGIIGDTITVFVDGDATYLPSLLLLQTNGTYRTYREVVSLNRGANVITFPFSASNGESGGTIYIQNPYTPESQGGNISVYIEGGGFYPVYRRGDDENAFISKLKEFTEARKQNDKIPDVAEIMPSHALFTVTASCLYDKYVDGNVSPKLNAELWSELIDNSFEFNGMPTSENSPYYERYEPILGHIRLNFKHMRMTNGEGAYAYYYLMGYPTEYMNFFADFNDSATGLELYYRVGHEMGHMFDIGAREFTETTNNMNATDFSIYLLGNRIGGDKFPYNKIQSHMFSDYTCDDKGFDDGDVLYKNGTDHNHLVWWILESVHPGYWGTLNNYYRYNVEPAPQLSNVERMVYYSSLIVGYDLSEYFERWGVRLTTTKFKLSTASASFKSLINAAISGGRIEESDFKLWYADEMQYAFSHTKEFELKQKEFEGEAKIVSVGKSGSNNIVYIERNSSSDFLGFEVLSKESGGEWKTAGFTYNNSFTDTRAYSGEVEYAVIGYNRYFSVSKMSDPMQVTATGNSAVCKYDGKEYNNIKEAIDAIHGSSQKTGTIYLLNDISVNALGLGYGDEVTIEVDESVKRDITISGPSDAIYLIRVNSNRLTLRGRENARICIDGGNMLRSNPAIYGSSTYFEAENVDFRNYASKVSGGAIWSIACEVKCKGCTFDGISSTGMAAAIQLSSKKGYFENCSFTNLIGSGTASVAAIVLDKSGDATFKNCQFDGNNNADIYWAGSLKFEGSVPNIKIAFADFDDKRSIALENVSEDDERNIVIDNDNYSAQYNGNSIDVVKAEFDLDFNYNGTKKSYKLHGSEFVFGQETFDDLVPKGQYIYEYKSGDGKTYHKGDRLSVKQNMSFTVTTKQYLTLTMSGINKEEKVELAEGEVFSLPRSFNGEVVKWEGDESFWAGSNIVCSENTSLHAVYVGKLSYRIIRKNVIKYGYANYGETVSLSEYSDSKKIIDDKGNVLSGSYAITHDTSIYVLSDDDKFYDLSAATVTLGDQNSVYYDGKEHRPSVTVTVGGEVVPAEYYKVVYSHNIDAGTASVKIVPRLYAYGEKSTSFTILPISLTQSDVTITNFASKLVYNTRAQKQIPTITYNGLTLSESDFTASYSGDLTNVGSVSVKIEFKGNYVGSISLGYDITRATRTMTVNIDDWTYGQEASVPSCHYDGEGGDVTYEYAADDSYSTTVPTQAGVYKLRATIAETNNYFAATSEPIEFTINKAKLTPPKDITTHEKTLVSVNLPKGWSFVEPSTALKMGKNEVEVEYFDKDNYLDPIATITVTLVEEWVEIPDSGDSDDDNPSENPGGETPGGTTPGGSPGGSPGGTSGGTKPSDPSENPGDSGENDNDPSENPSENDPNENGNDDKNGCASCGTMTFGGMGGGIGGGIVGVLAALLISAFLLIFPHRKQRTEK